MVFRSAISGFSFFYSALMISEEGSLLLGSSSRYKRPQPGRRAPGGPLPLRHHPRLSDVPKSIRGNRRGCNRFSAPCSFFQSMGFVSWRQFVNSADGVKGLGDGTEQRKGPGLKRQVKKKRKAGWNREERAK